jgi:hypothetical protein
MTVLRVRKFAPEDPVVFLSSASQIALLGTEVAQALVRFYYRLSCWRRDTENVAVYGLLREGIVDPKNVQFLAKRLRQTITPGIRALEALSPLVDDCASIDASSLTSYDEHREGVAVSGTLHDRLKRLAG